MGEKPQVLIVGAGAMGMVTGYHLSLAGAEVTFLVRASRMASMQRPILLYCYDDTTLREFRTYSATSSLPDLRATRFDYVLITLDGATARSAESTALLKAIGDQMRSTSGKAIIGGVGIGLRAHIRAATELPETQLLNGLLALLSYQVARAQMPLHGPTNAQLLAQAQFAYRHFLRGVGFFVDATLAGPAREFAGMYNRCGVSRCSILSKSAYQILSNMSFPQFAVSEIAGWPPLEVLASQRELWRLNCRAQNEIAALPQHGWVGRIIGLLMSEKMHLRLQRKVERDALPLDYNAFNRFHHGEKVQSQDTEIMQNCLASGQGQGWPMPALQELLSRLKSHRLQNPILPPA